MSDSAKSPGGAIWKTGVHKVSLKGQPVRLAAPQYSLIQNYNLMKRKIRDDGHITIGIDHLPETVLAANPILKKLLDEKKINPYDVGKILDVSTDGDSIRVEKAELTDQTVQDLFDHGELNAWSVVEDIKASECLTDKADVVADYFADIERVDLVGRGGCETCLVEGGGVPEGYEKINASYMEVDKVSEENRTEETEETNEEEQNNQEEESGGSESQEGTEDGGGDTSEETSENDRIFQLQTQVKKLVETVGTLTKTVTGIVEGTIEAKLPESLENKFKEVDKLKLEASEAKLGSIIDGKIQAGLVTPAMKDGLMEAGLAMDEEGFGKLMAGYKEKIWDPEEHANHSQGEGDGDFDYKKYKETCEEHGMTP